MFLHKQELFSPFHWVRLAATVSWHNVNMKPSVLLNINLAVAQALKGHAFTVGVTELTQYYNASHGWEVLDNFFFLKIK